jgi:hypothetical protein
MSEFTVPEINFICIFADKNKEKTIDNIMKAIPDFTENEMTEIAENVIVKLDTICESDFLQINFTDEFCDEYGQ